MLVFNLQKKWFEKIRLGEKKTEYRLVKPFWIKRINNSFEQNAGYSFDVYLENKRLGEDIELNIPCRFVLGYTKTILNGIIKSIDVEFKECTDLKDDTSDIDKCFAFDFILKE